jgi:hypothetical protein
MTEAIDNAIDKLVTSGLATSDEMVGCTEAELVSLERAYELRLPIAYRQFLGRLGNVAGQFLVGTDFLFSQLRELKQHAEALLRESGAAFQLTETDFVFAMHQGYQFLFFRAEESPDPQVFHYEENDTEARCVAPSFTVWLDGCVADEIAIAAELGSR